MGGQAWMLLQVGAERFLIPGCYAHRVHKPRMTLAELRDLNAAQAGEGWHLMACDVIQFAVVARPRMLGGPPVYKPGSLA